MILFLLYLQVSLGSLAAADQPHHEPCAVQVAVQVSGRISFDHFGCKFSDCGGCKFRGCTLLVFQVERL